MVRGHCVIEPEAEERLEGPREGGLDESIDEGPDSNTVEGDSPCFIVQENLYLARGFTQGEEGPKGGEGLILINM